MIRAILACLLLVVAAIPEPASAQTERQVSIVLVHGAFVDGSGWQAVHDILTRRGFEVLVVQNPTISLRGDVEATTRVIARARHPVVLVGHSYGGAVITEAGNHALVRSLVYVAAFAPDVGESVFELATRPVPGEPGPPLLPPSNGYLLVDPAQFPAAFAAGADPATTRFMAAAQVPWGLEAVQARIGTAAWRTKPSHFMVTTEDRMIPPTTLRMMARRAGGPSVEIRSSHAVMLTQPQELAAFIEAAAGGAN